jgi:four helix bundle protein
MNNKDSRERTFEFALRISKLCNELNKRPGVCREMSRQLLKAGTSVGANTEEAQAAQSKADFISKNSIALKEPAGNPFLLRLLIASELMSEKKLAPLRDEAEELRRFLVPLWFQLSALKKLYNSFCLFHFALCLAVCASGLT